MPLPHPQPIATALLVSATSGDGGFDTVVDWFDDPRVAFVLLTLGIASVTVEVANPGIVGTGVAGVALILAGLWSLSLQPVNPVGLGLVAVAAGLFIAELFTPTTGVAAALGSIVLVIGGLLLVDDPDGGVPAPLVVPMSVVLGGGAVLAGRLAVRSRSLPAITGAGRLLDREVTLARVDEDGTGGDVFTDGAWWRVRSTGAVLRAGTRVRIVAIDGLVLVVDPRTPLAKDGTDHE